MNEQKVFLLEDNLSLAVGFKITPLPCEARPAEMMDKIAQAFKESLQNAIPQEKSHPWILQIICDARTTHSRSVLQAVQAAIEPERQSEPLVQAHLSHVKIPFGLCQPPGGHFCRSAGHAAGISWRNLASLCFFISA